MCKLCLLLNFTIYLCVAKIPSMEVALMFETACDKINYIML